MNLSPNIALFVIALGLVTCEREPPDDKPGAGDTAGGGGVTSVSPDFPQTEIGLMLTTHMAALAGHGTDAEEAYQESLKALRAQALEATRQLVQSYETVSEDRYFRRWALLETIRELHHPSSIDLASRVAESPLPPERFVDDPERSSQDEELRIRVKAVEILAALAADRVPDADTVLLRLVRHEDLSIRRAAIRGYLVAGGSDEQTRRGDELRRLVAETDYPLITLDSTEIRGIPHPDMPESFELRKERAGEGSAPSVRK